VARMKWKSRVPWLVGLLPMAALPIAIPASVGSGVPLAVSLLAWAGFLALPAILCLLLIRLNAWLNRFNKVASHAIMGIAGGMPYLILVRAWMGMSGLWRMEFEGGPCGFLSNWHSGHLLAPAGLMLLAAVLCVVECVKSQSAKSRQCILKSRDAQHQDSALASANVPSPL